LSRASRSRATSRITQSGSLILLNGAPAARTQVINLPTITAADLGTYYDFIVTVIGAVGANSGAYTISTGGHPTNLALAATPSTDDFIGTLHVIEADGVSVATDAYAVTPAVGEGTMNLANNTTNGDAVVGSSFRCTAVSPSIAAAGGGTDVWLLTGLLLTTQATGFVTTALFSA